MTSHSGHNKFASSRHPEANWQWLQDRLNTLAQAEQLGEWMTTDLLELEEDFVALITVRSRARSLSAELARDNTRR